jgi:hypothetical protein
MDGASAIMGALNHHQHEGTTGFVGKGEHTGAKTCDPVIKFSPFSISF